MNRIRLWSSLMVLSLSTSALAAPVFVNEIHYDNSGTDTGELIEVAALAGTDLTGWSLVLYNGSNGTVYNTLNLSGSVNDQCEGLGTSLVTLPSNGLQNGSPDGIALVDDSGVVVQFISYEGSFAAIGGPADGQLSEDIGVSEASSTPIGFSLQLTGDGLDSDDFTWVAPAMGTPGACNTGQNEDAGPPVVADLFINEVHYDNTGADTGEFFEIAGAAGDSLDGWQVVLYNGSNGTSYGSVVLAGTISDQCEGFGAVSFPRTGLQNGAPDGLALIDNVGTVVEFISYEGSLTASGGPADGMTSVDIGVVETSSTPVGESLQKIGTGTSGSDFTWSGPSAESPGDCNVGQTFGDPVPPEQPATVFVHEVQGTGDASPLLGQDVVVEAVVTATFQESGQIGGFFVQEEDTDVDADPATSEGLFIFSSTAVAIGDLVRVTGQPTEFFGLTQIGSGNTVEILSNGNMVPTPSTISDLVAINPDGLEALENMQVTFGERMTVVEYFNLDRFGTVALSATGRLYQPTQVMTPGPDAVDQQSANSAQQLLLDDGSNSQNPDVILHGRGGLPLSADNILRGGDYVDDLTGIMHYSFGAYRVQPSEPVDFQVGNERPVSPPLVGGSLRVASFNVLNYFVTIDDSRSRGANTPEELARQRDKLVRAIVELDADILGLVEIENDLGGADVATVDLVSALNAVVGDVWSYVPTGAIGTDAIKVAFIYKHDMALPEGSFAVLDSSVDPDFVDTKNRPALAQSFVEIGTGEVFTAVVNHFKSKGSSCSDIGDPTDPNGQANCNGTRTLAAIALADWLATDPTASGDADVVILGDLNAYAEPSR
ncbi:MAG: ExeM/NucH family extracellular endonuclease [Pseudomonadota bacterium]